MTALRVNAPYPIAMGDAAWEAAQTAEALKGATATLTRLAALQGLELTGPVRLVDQEMAFIDWVDGHIVPRLHGSMTCAERAEFGVVPQLLVLTFESDAVVAVPAAA